MMMWRHIRGGLFVTVLPGLCLLLLLAANTSAAANPLATHVLAATGSWSAVAGDDDDNGDDDDDDGDDDEYVADQVVVKLDLANGVTIDAIHATYGTTTLETLLASRGVYLLQTPPNTDIEQLTDQMAADARLIYAEPNFYGELPEGGSRRRWTWGGADPSSVGNQYAASMLRLAEVHALGRGGQTVVAILDTGFQLDHPALVAHWTAARYDFVDDDAMPDEDFANLDQNGDGYVDESAGHGTHVAAIVSLTAPDAQLMPLRVLNASGRGNVFLIAEAVLFAVENGAQVINMSLGMAGESELLGEVIEEAVETHEVVIVAAAGNLNSANPMYPAAEEDVLAVSAVDAGKAKADFANYGSWVDIAAPGTEIYSAFPISSYAYWSGTSMATPFIAGQAALLQGLHPALSAQDIQGCIRDTAQPLTPELGAGLADLMASLTVTKTICTGPLDDDDDDDDPVDADLDTVPTQQEDLNGNGILQDDDTDGDGAPNYLDPDDDNDGLLTQAEMIGGATPQTSDSDGDGTLNYLDPDDDNDTIPTAGEDANGNGSPQDDDSDQDGLGNYLDPDDDNDTLATMNEDVNGNGNPQDDDSDGDGLANYLDPDDDNDALLTVNENPGGSDSPADDHDGDGAPNYLDPDDDNDTLPTIDEDANGNGNPQDDDSDGDSIPDYLDQQNDNPVDPGITPTIFYLPIIQRWEAITTPPIETDD